VHPVDHERHQIQARRSRVIRSVNAASVALTNRREIADLLVEVASAATCSPTGSNPTW